jgi:hypothetical protein
LVREDAVSKISSNDRFERLCRQLLAERTAAKSAKAKAAASQPEGTISSAAQSQREADAFGPTPTKAPAKSDAFEPAQTPRRR